MKKIKIYLDTSVISHLASEDTPEKMSDTLDFWRELEKDKYLVTISDLTIAELTKCPEPKRTILFEYLSAINFDYNWMQIYCKLEFQTLCKY